MGYLFIYLFFTKNFIESVFNDILEGKILCVAILFLLLWLECYAFHLVFERYIFWKDETVIML